MRFDGGRLLSRLGLILGDFLAVKSPGSLRREFRVGPPGARFLFLNDPFFRYACFFHRYLSISVFWRYSFFGNQCFQKSVFFER